MVKTGRMTYPSKHYKPYKAEMYVGMKTLKPIPQGCPIRVILKFNVKKGVEENKWVVKLKKTGNTSKVFNTESEALGYLKEEKHYMEERPLVINYGSVPDVDNAMKGVMDSLEEFEIIHNDRNVVEVSITNTFNNEEESIEITLEELEVIDNGVISFTNKLKYTL